MNPWEQDEIVGEGTAAKQNNVVSSESQINTPWEQDTEVDPQPEPNTSNKESSFIEDAVFRPMSQFNIGLANMLGLPEVGANLIRETLGSEEKSVFPSSKEIQQKMSDLDMTYAPGTEPDSVADRLNQNLGASAIPFGGGAVRTGYKMAKGGYSIAKAAVSELLASVGGASGGKLLESTDWGKENPQLARAVGEIGGGLGLSSVTSINPKKITTPGIAAYQMARRPFVGTAAENRAAREVQGLVTDPNRTLKNMETQGFSGIPSDEQGLLSLKNQVDSDDMSLNLLSEQKRSKNLVQGKSEIQGDIEVAREFLITKFKALSKSATDALNKIKNPNSAELYSKAATGKINEAYREARTAEKAIWQKLPEGDSAVPNNLLDSYKDELNSITRGGDIKNIDSFVKEKLGNFNKKGELVNGSFINVKTPAANAKELQQFQSELTAKVRTLSQEAGNANKIRILNKLKRATIKDLDAVSVGADYKAARAFSYDLNQKFTNGDIGGVLGFNRGLATPETLVLDELVSKGGEEAKLAIDQLFKGTPGAKEDTINFIKAQFVKATENTNIGRIDVNKGNLFIKNNKRLLEAIPELGDDIADAVKTQRSVDTFVGVPDATGASPLIKDKSATSLYINAEPGDEMKRLLNHGKSKGKTTEYLSKLVKMTKGDKTGSAYRGLQSSYTEELINSSVMSDVVDGISSDSFINGTKFLKKLRGLKKQSIDSGLLTEKEYSRLEIIGESFKRVEKELTTKPRKGQIMTDTPGMIMDILARIVGARVGGKLGGGSAGGSIQMAGMGSGLAKKFVNWLTKDEAKEILIKATTDDGLMKDLLVKAAKLSDDDQLSLFNKIRNSASDIVSSTKKSITEASPPVMAVSPGVVSGLQNSDRNEQGYQIQTADPNAQATHTYIPGQGIRLK